MEKPNNLIEINELPKGDIVEKRIQSKPFTAIVIVLLAGIAMIVSKYLLIMGILLVALSLFGLFAVKGRVQFEVYGGYAVIYPEKYPNECEIVYWKDVAEWTINHQQAANDILHIRLKNGTDIQESVINGSQIFKALNKKIPDQESSYITQQKINERQKDSLKKGRTIKWPWKKK